MEERGFKNIQLLSKCFSRSHLPSLQTNNVSKETKKTFILPKKRNRKQDILVLENKYTKDYIYLILSS